MVSTRVLMRKFCQLTVFFLLASTTSVVPHTYPLTTFTVAVNRYRVDPRFEATCSTMNRARLALAEIYTNPDFEHRDLVEAESLLARCFNFNIDPRQKTCWQKRVVWHESDRK